MAVTLELRHKLRVGFGISPRHFHKWQNELPRRAVLITGMFPSCLVPLTGLLLESIPSFPRNPGGMLRALLNYLASEILRGQLKPPRQ